MSGTRSPEKLLRTAAALVVGVGIGMTTWLVVQAGQNPDVRAKRPSWFENGLFDVPFWVPLIATVAIGIACVVYVYLRAARRLSDGEDIRAQSFRDRQRRGEVGEQP